MRTGKIVLLLAVLAIVWPDGAGLGAHEAGHFDDFDPQAYEPDAYRTIAPTP